MASQLSSRFGWIVAGVVTMAAVLANPTKKDTRCVSGLCLPTEAAEPSQAMPRMEIERGSSSGFAKTVEQLKAAVKAHNFSVLFEIDLQAKLKEKGIDMEPTLILGVCSGKYSALALNDDVRIAPMLPCRISVVERGGKVTVATLDAKMMAKMYSGPNMEKVGSEVDTALRAMLAEATQ